MRDDEPRKQSAAGCIFRDSLGRILIVEPAYKPTWEIPGGEIEVGESPRTACEREIREELDLAVSVGPLLVVDHESSRDSYRFVFDGGVLEDANVARIRLDPKELLSYRFATLAEAAELLNGRLAQRIAAIVSGGVGPYLEDGADPYRRP